MELKLTGGEGCFKNISIISVRGSRALRQRTNVREGHYEYCVLERTTTVESRELRQVQ